MDDYFLKQKDLLVFDCEISLSSSPVSIMEEFEKWLLENVNDDTYHISVVAYGTHAYTARIEFFDMAAASAFKLRWV